MATPAVVPDHRQVHFKDEGQDVLGDVLKDPNRQAMSGDTGTFFEPIKEQPQETPAVTQQAPEVQKQAVPDSPQKPTEPSKEPPAPPEPKLYAGKFKTIEDMEKGYLESQKVLTQKFQESAAAKKALEQAEATRKASPENTGAANEEARLQLINDFLTDPTKVVNQIQERVVASAAEQAKVQASVTAWREQNKDVTRYERYIGVVMHDLTSADPELEPMAALDKATTLVREELGRIREEGKLEALSVQQSVTQIADAKVNTPPPTEHPSQAPMSEEQGFEAHMASLKANAASVRRAVR